MHMNLARSEFAASRRSMPRPAATLVIMMTHERDGAGVSAQKVPKFEVGEPFSGT